MPQNLEHSGSSWKGQQLKHQTSLIDRFDARVRIVLIALFACVVVLPNSLLVAGIGLLIGLLLVVLARLNMKRIFRRVLAMDMFMIFLIIMLPFTTPIKVPADILFELFGLQASRQGLLHAVLIAVKANAVVLALLAVVGTMSATQFGHSLARIGVSEKLVHLLLFTVRYLDVIGQEYKRMRRAMQARAFVLRVDKHTWRSIGYLIGMLLIRAMERSERIMNAMKCRGYHGQFYLLDHGSLAARDYYLVALSVPFLGMLIGMALIL